MAHAGMDTRLRPNLLRCCYPSTPEPLRIDDTSVASTSGVQQTERQSPAIEAALNNAWKLLLRASLLLAVMVAGVRCSIYSVNSPLVFA